MPLSSWLIPALSLGALTSVFAVVAGGAWRRRQRLLGWLRFWEQALADPQRYQRQQADGSASARRLVDDYFALSDQALTSAAGLAGCNELVVDLNGYLRRGSPYARLGWRVCVAASLGCATLTWREPLVAAIVILLGTVYAGVCFSIGRSADFYERRIFLLWRPLIAALRASFSVSEAGA